MKKIFKKQKMLGKKNRINKKIILLFVFVFLIFVFSYCKYDESNQIKDIEGHYNDVVITNRKCKIYNKNKKVIGNVSKNTSFILDKKNIKSKNDKYFKVKDTNYYIYYNCVNKIKKYNKETISNKYLYFNQNIISKKMIFYKNNKVVFSINENMSLPIRYMDDKYYYVLYLDKVLGVKKDSVKVKEVDNSNDIESSYVSVINYNKIYDKTKEQCDESSCIDINNVKNNIIYLKKNGYYTITMSEYVNWVNDNIRLKDKAIVLTTNNEYDLSLNDDNIKIENINSSSYKLNLNNTKNTKGNRDSINGYSVLKITTDDEFKKMVLGEQIIKIVQKTNCNSSGVGIPVLNYHFFYDPNQGEVCNENICLETDTFKKQLSYLKENGYYTLTIEEFVKWMYGEITLPEKSILITIDDGAMGTSKINGNKLIPILEEYKMHATLFLITAWWDKGNYQSKYLDVESHGDDIHITGSCGKAKIHCLSSNELVNDFRLSVQKLGSSTAFCYPFYAYNDTAIKVVSEVGFKVAFAGGSRKAKQSDNKFIIPRYPIHKSTTWEHFISMVS